MKKITTNAICTIGMIMLCTTFNVSNAQVFDLLNIGGNRWGRVNPNVAWNANSIGIGNFPASPLAALHVNTNSLPASTVFTPGEVFRTDCPTLSSTNNINAWRMLTNGTEIGRFFHRFTSPTTNTHFNLQSSAGDMIFLTGGGNTGFGTERVRIVNATGRVGIATNNPLVALDVNGSVNVRNISQVNVARGFHIDTGIVVATYGIASNIFIGNGAGTWNNPNLFLPPNPPPAFPLGIENTFAGRLAGPFNKYGNDNVFLGFDAGFNSGAFSQDDNNVYVGAFSGDNNRGDNNTFIGFFSDRTTTNVSNSTAIGAFATVTQNNSLILGAINGLNGYTCATCSTVTVGIGTTAPAERFSVGSTSQFRVNGTGNLTRINDVPYSWTSTQGAANTVLTNDGSGNLSWQTVSGGGGGTITGSCSSGANYIPKMSSQTAITCSNIYDDGTNVGIGTTTTSARLHVKGVDNLSTSYAVKVDNSSSVNMFNVTNEGYFTLGANNRANILGTFAGGLTLSSLTASLNILLNNTFSGLVVGDVNGLRFRPDNFGTATIALTMTAYNGSQYIEGFRYENVSSGAPNILLVPTVGNVGIGTTTPTEILEITGNGKCPPANGWYNNSDSRLKKNIDTISNALDIVSSLNGIYFEVDTDAYNNFFPPQVVINPDDSSTYTVYHNFALGRKVGFLAQDVQPYLPEVVSIDANGFYSMDYSKVVPVLVESIKELSARVDILEGGGQQLRKGNTDQTGETIQRTIKNIELASNSIVLEQNVPNPFAESTVINYTIPENAGYAQIIFSDNTGKVIRVVDVSEKGNGQLNVYAANLSSGMYSYSIVVDGKVIDTKKMLKTK